MDRGKNSLEILLILFGFLLVYPNDVHLNRGNHEDHMVNLRSAGGFNNSLLNCLWCILIKFLYLFFSFVYNRYGFNKEVLGKYRVCIFLYHLHCVERHLCLFVTESVTFRLYHFSLRSHNGLASDIDTQCLTPRKAFWYCFTLINWYKWVSVERISLQDFSFYHNHDMY